MEIIQSHYPLMLLYSLLIGISLSAVWDIFRIIHIALLPLSVNKRLSIVYNTVIFAGDIIFALISAFTCAIFTFHTNDGRIRLVILAAIVAGFFIYRLTVGRVIIFLSDMIISFIYKVVSFIFMHTLYPILKLLHRFYLFIFDKVYNFYLSKASSRSKRMLLAIASRGFIGDESTKVKNTRTINRGKTESQNKEKNEHIS